MDSLNGLYIRQVGLTRYCRYRLSAGTVSIVIPILREEIKFRGKYSRPVITQAEIHDLFREHADEPWIADAAYMIGLGFDISVVQENLEYRYRDPSLYREFLSALEEESSLEVECSDSDTLTFRDTDDETVKVYRVSIEGTDTSLQDELQQAYIETMALRGPDNLSVLVNDLPEQRRVLASIIRARTRDHGGTKIDQDFVWGVYTMLRDGGFTRKARNYFTTQLVSDGLVFKDGSTIYPRPELTDPDELETALPTLQVTDLN